MGESFGLYQIGKDEEMMQYITSANIACGFHGGDPHVMRKTVELANQYGVGVGAHPGFPDLIGFGRRHMKCTPMEVKDYVTYQVGALREFASASGLKLRHCKPHGALYMMAMEDEQLARAILEAIAAVDPTMIVFALNNSAVALEGRRMGIQVAKEVYADREHTTTGSIVLTRTGPNIHNYEAMARRVAEMVMNSKVIAHTGEETTITVQTVCIHSDTPGAVQLASAIASELKQNGVEIANISEIIGGGC